MGRKSKYQFDSAALAALVEKNSSYKCSETAARKCQEYFASKGIRHSTITECAQAIIHYKDVRGAFPRIEKRQGAAETLQKSTDPSGKANAVAPLMAAAVTVLRNMGIQSISFFPA